LKYEIYILDEELIKFRILENSQNQGAKNPENSIKAHYEYYQVINNYQQLSSFQDLVRVFPEAKKYYREEGCDTGFIMAFIAVENPGQPFKKLFGLNQLFAILNNPLRAKRVEELYGFTHKDFIKLTGQHDIFSNEIKADLRKRLARKTAVIEKQEKYIRKLKTQAAAKYQLVRRLQNDNKRLQTTIIEQTKTYETQIEALMTTIEQMERSPGWKMGTKIMKGASIIAPTKSLRRKFIKKIYRSILKPIVYRKENKKLKDQKKLIARSGFFDRGWYLKHNPDVAAAQIDPLEHYTLYGGLEGRDPGPNFDSDKYSNTYEEVKQAGVNPLIHYLQSDRTRD
jgi:hypothetical protein